MPLTPLPKLWEKISRRSLEAGARVRQAAVERGVLPGHRQYRRFFVLATIRTGSTMLGSYLGSHPNVRMFFELYHRYPSAVPFDHLGYRARGRNPAVVQKRNTDPVGLLEEHVFTRQPRSVQAVGFKLLYTQARQGPQWWHAPEFDRWWAHLDLNEEPDWAAARSDLWAYLAAERDIAVIHLTRENPLRGQVSAELAKQTGRWGIGATGGAGAETGRATVRLNPEHCLQDFEAGKRKQDEANALFAQHPIAHVTYEELVTQPGPTLARLQEFLGVPVQPLQTRTRKQNRRRLPEVIENYHELAEAFRGTRWHHLLEEPK